LKFKQNAQLGSIKHKFDLIIFAVELITFDMYYNSWHFVNVLYFMRWASLMPEYHVPRYILW